MTHEEERLLIKRDRERRKVIGWSLLAGIPFVPLLWYGVYQMLSPSDSAIMTCVASALASIIVGGISACVLLDE